MKDSQNPYAATDSQDEIGKAQSSQVMSGFIGAFIGIAAWALFYFLEQVGIPLPIVPCIYFMIAGAISWFSGWRAMSFLLGLGFGYALLATPWMAVDPLFPVNAVICSLTVLCSILGMGFALLVSGQH